MLRVILFQCLHEPTLASEAAAALTSICGQCRNHMAEHFMGLLQILEQVDSFKLKPEAANGLIKGVVMIISIMTNAEQLAEAVEKVCLIQVTPLNNIMNTSASMSEPPKITKHSATDPVL